MKSKKTYPGINDYSRYQTNRMSKKERYKFERYLQSHPFEEEAFEGMAFLDKQTLTRDMGQLSSLINKKEKKSTLKYWVAAASLLLIVTSGIVLLQYSKNMEPALVSENKLDEKPNITIEPEKIEEDIQKEIAPSATPVIVLKEEDMDEETILEKSKDIPSKNHSAKQIQINETEQQVVKTDTPEFTDIAPKAVEKSPPLPEKNIQLNIINDDLNNDGTLFEMKATPTFEEGIHRIIEGKIIQEDLLKPSPPVYTGKNKGSENIAYSDQQGNFYIPAEGTSKIVQITNLQGDLLKEEDITDDTVVKISLPSMVSSKALEKGIISEKMLSRNDYKMDNQPAKPETGFINYYKYLEEASILPESFNDTTITIPISFTVNESGEIQDFTFPTNPSLEIQKLAVKIITDGSKWGAATNRGNKTESLVTLTLQFHKKK